MNKTKPTGEITGKINADPNPLFFGQRCVISWETNDPAGAEIRVSTGTDDEKLVTQGGQIWSRGNSVDQRTPRYMSFGLYAASSPEVAIDSVKARREHRVCAGRAPRNCRRSEAGKYRDGGAFSLYCGDNSELS